MMSAPQVTSASTLKIYGIFKSIGEATPLSVCGVSKGLLTNSPLIVDAGDYRRLLDELSFYSGPNRKYKIVRFLLTVDNKLKFAKEGLPIDTVAAHYQMTEKSFHEATCFTAGNAYFDDQNQLCLISNKSGDFRPSFDSLQFALKSIVAAKIPVAKRLLLHECNATGYTEHVLLDLYAVVENEKARPLEAVESQAMASLQGRADQPLKTLPSASILPSASKRSLDPAIISSIRFQVLSLLTAEQRRLEGEYREGKTSCFAKFINLSDVRIDALNTLIKDIEGHLQLPLTDEDYKNRIVSSINEQLIHSKLDKYSGWARTFGRLLLNAVLLVFSPLSLPLKKYCTGSWFFSLSGKTQEVAKKAYCQAQALRVTATQPRGGRGS